MNFYFNYVNIRVCAHDYRGLGNQSRVLDTLEMVGRSPVRRVLVTKLRSSAKAVHALSL